MGFEDDNVEMGHRSQGRLDIGQGVQHIRNHLRTSNKALRIVGLSGVGKTRVVQALFEDSVGTEPLDRSLAIYADLGTEPLPNPRQVLARLKAHDRPAVLVLDNCPATTHRLLAGEASDAADIRLITIEYDIREDKPELTTVIRVDAEGPEIVETLVARRHPSLDRRNARSIAEFSGGNARVALALANAVEDNENLSEFSDAQLFDRLFHQRGTQDQGLLAAAQTLALVYSFSVAPDEARVSRPPRCRRRDGGTSGAAFGGAVPGKGNRPPAGRRYASRRAAGRRHVLPPGAQSHDV